MHFVFFGTPELCIPILEKLKEAGYVPSVVVTAPDRPMGRKQILTPPPVKMWALQNNIEVLQPEKLDENFLSQLSKSDFQVFIVVAYGKILPREIIELPKFGTLNIHYSLLPRWRGASPVEAAILAGDKTTGVCIQKMVFELDAGDVLVCKEIRIEESETAPELRDRLNTIGADMLVELLQHYCAKEIEGTQQDESNVTYCRRIKREDGEVNLETMSGEELWRRYRAYYSWPGIFFFDPQGKRVKITSAEFMNGIFQIKKIIPEGKSEIEWEKFKKIKFSH